MSFPIVLSRDSMPGAVPPWCRAFIHPRRWHWGCPCACPGVQSWQSHLTFLNLDASSPQRGRQCPPSLPLRPFQRQNETKGKTAPCSQPGRPGPSGRLRVLLRQGPLSPRCRLRLAGPLCFPSDRRAAQPPCPLVPFTGQSMSSSRRASQGRHGKAKRLPVRFCGESVGVSRRRLLGKRAPAFLSLAEFSSS